MSAITEIGSLIVRSPQVPGGRPRIAGTGVTVRRIVSWYKLGLNPEEIVDDFGHLTLAQVYAALAYYHANREEIEADLTAEEMEADRLEQATIPGPEWRTALNRFVRDLRVLYGPRLHKVLLYGSRARGQAAADSDIDTLVVLDPSEDFWTEFGRISRIADRLSLEHDVVISAIPADRRDFESTRSPPFLNIHREGLLIE